MYQVQLDVKFVKVLAVVVVAVALGELVASFVVDALGIGKCLFDFLGTASQ